MSPFTSVSAAAIPPSAALCRKPKPAQRPSEATTLNHRFKKYYDMMIPLAAAHFKYISKIFYVQIIANAIAAACTIIISGRPTINRLCLVLCRTAIMVRYIAAEPPRSAVMNSVFSAIRRLCFWARDLSDTVIITAAAFIIARYIRKYFIDIPLFQTNKLTVEAAKSTEKAANKTRER